VAGSSSRHWCAVAIVGREWVFGERIETDVLLRRWQALAARRKANAHRPGESHRKGSGFSLAALSPVHPQARPQLLHPKSDPLGQLVTEDPGGVADPVYEHFVEIKEDH
jgi:hypothetical protein